MSSPGGAGGEGLERPGLEEWRARADRELRDRGPEDLVAATPEGLPVKPIYTAEDLRVGLFTSTDNF